MKKDFTYLLNWLTALTVSTVLWAFVSGFVTSLLGTIFSSIFVRHFAGWLIGTLLICSALVSVSWKTGLKINSKSKPVSLVTPVLNIVIGAVLYVVVFALTKGHYIAGPSTLHLAKALQNDGDPTFVVTFSLSALIGLCVLQTIVYSAVSLGAYILAKYKQDHKNETVRKLREESKNAENIDR